jgi:hypothetical protein
MGTVQQIEQAIARLGEAETAEIRAWLFEREITRDATRGKLDALAAEALRAGHDGQR